MNQNKRIGSLDFYKFLLSLIIVLLHSNWQFCPQGYLAVESFFIIGGFWLCLGYENIKQRAMSASIFTRLRRLFPSYLIVFLIFAIKGMVRHNNNYLTQMPMYIFGMQVFGVKGTEYNFIGDIGFLWFIPVYIIVSVVFIFLIRYLSKEKIAFISFLMFLSSFAMIVYQSPSGGLNYTLEKFTMFIPIGYLRGFMGISLGYLCGYIAELCSQKIVSRKSAVKTVAVTVIEALLILYFIYVFFHEVSPFYDYSYLLSAAVFVILIYIQKGYISRFMEFYTETRIGTFMSRLSMPIYFVHYIFVSEYIIKYGGYVSAEHLIYIYALSTIGAAALLYADKGLQKLIDACLQKYTANENK